jgi:cystathionine beta-lyase/cystathionine gamma-synthase
MTGLPGMISFVLDGAAAAAAVVNRLAMFAIAPSLGGLESIVTQPVHADRVGAERADGPVVPAGRPRPARRHVSVNLAWFQAR